MSLTAVLATAGMIRADDLVNQTDRTFVATTNQQCLFASRLAGAASNQAASPAIKAVGSATADQQMRVCVELKRLADKWQIGTPGVLERPFSERHDRIVGLSGPAFDGEYQAAMARSDAIVAAAAADEIKSGSNPDFKAFAAGLLAGHTTSTSAGPTAP